MKLLDGRRVADELLEELKTEIETWTKKGERPPKLTVVLVGNDAASLAYIAQKERACKRVGIESEILRLKESETTTASLIAVIEKLNNDATVTGFIVQMPLPSQVESALALKNVDPAKDVDGFHAYNLGKMFLSDRFEHLAPCTPRGVIRLLAYYGIEVRGRSVCLIGASNMVGKPLAVMLLNRGATITVCNSKTKDLAAFSSHADIVVVAAGRVNLLKAEMVKEGAVVIDVGINRLENGELVGDADFAAMAEKCSAITPVPGGVGPMTVACLLENTVATWKRQRQLIS